jgi:GTP-binding protein Era
VSEPNHRAGFVAIAGRPNAGKSTLLNALIGEKVAITAPQPQTTRTSLQGVLTAPGSQIIFVDTPGIHRSDTLFNKRMMETVRGALQNRDLVVYVVDASKAVTEEDEHAVGALAHAEQTLLVPNKIDRMGDKRLLLPLIERYQQLFAFLEAIPVSARTGDGIEQLKHAIVEQLPESPPLFPEDHLTDQPMRFMAAEIIREHILRAAREEVPHAAAVLIDTWQERSSLTRISATIYVERPGQKTILIGAKGGLLKKIGTQARQDIERLIGSKVFLSLFVKVKPKWRENPEFLDAIDWRATVGNEQQD